MRRLLAILARLLRLRSRRATRTAPAGPFAALTGAEQEIAVQYLIASAKVQSCLEGIRDRKRAVDHLEHLAAYDQAETAYVRAGFVPFLPSSLRGRLASCEYADIERSGLVRKGDDHSHVFVTHYAAGIRQQAARLLARGDVSFLDTAAAERRFQEIIAEGRPPAATPLVRQQGKSGRSGSHLRLV